MSTWIVCERKNPTLSKGDNMKLPEYKYYKHVRAAKITAIDRPLVECGEQNLFVRESEDWFAIQGPQVGGYYVLDDIGNPHYISAEPFERDYIPVL